MRYGTPLKELFEESKGLHILGCGVHVLLSDRTIREVQMTPKLADKILGLVTHIHGGKINLGHQIEISYVPQPPPVSREKERDYIPLSRQLEYCEFSYQQGRRH